MGIRQILKIALREGVATLEYPFKPEEAPEDFRGKPEIDPSICMGCGACANVCPPDAITCVDDLERGLRTWKIFYGRCIFCGRCEEACPLSAIRQSKEYELASKTREDLEVVVETPLARCSTCGKYFPVTEREVAQAAQILAEAKTLPRSVLELLENGVECPECKRRRTVLSIVKSARPGVKPLSVTGEEGGRHE
ncbi:4Fe-4S dicluster domain-containing protein [Thermofilum pendens]|uniref:4Fe-4S ferredoxin, iron-sulfur binding domain protein n=1 Tax=Thermofilum pendens (strain DSM 2475 / Hrk 5) TaxID=368408 RepID=A1RWL2_THEPD|nr:4Fe-4S dicluster domain-containing protein [Thermofilum pendens]ABL77592.1 4Fe-4S ferredoxin, iron-sulfur binding domain protein [Thermofilum pendens Hrk 5]